MKHVVFSVNETKSYYKEYTRDFTKPNVALPFVVSLLPGGKVSLTMDEKRNKAYGDLENLKFSTDQFEKNTQANITGNLQTFEIVIHSNVLMSFDPQDGKILSIDGGFGGIIPEASGGAGNVWFSMAGPSNFGDANSPTFNLENGLGCGGSIVIDATWETNPDFQGPYNMIHIEGLVSMEDVDGDGNFERACPILGPGKKVDVYTIPGEDSLGVQAMKYLRTIRISQIIKEFHLQPMTAKERRTYSTKTPTQFRCAIGVPHLHYKGKAYLLKTKQWNAITSKVQKELGKKLSSAKSVTFDELIETSRVVQKI